MRNTKPTCLGPSKSASFSEKYIARAVAMAIVAISGSLQAAETGRIGDIASWESTEYLADWGLDSMKASYAYAQGITGKSIKVGVIDSGAALHPELIGERWHRVQAKGQYWADGQRYPNADGPVNDNKNGRFVAGEAFDVSSDYQHGVSDSHGTHVAGTVGANRDGVGMHGVAFDAQMYLGSTGGNDNMVYGENQDYGYFKSLYQAMADQGVKVINQSWGSATSNDFGKAQYWESLAAFESKGKTFVDAAAEVALENDMIFVWTNGNNGNINPYLRASLPHFRPELQKHWLTVAAGNETGLEGFSGKAGIARWWTVTAPGKDINSAFVDYQNDGNFVGSDGQPLYKKYSGTSQAAPHATGALALVMERFDYMTPTQARDVLMTTATKTPGGSEFLRTPDDKIGWGYVNLKEAMRGPRQILGTLDVTINDRDDTWTHNIVEDAYNAGRFVTPRSLKEQDKADKKQWDSRKPVLEAKIADQTITQVERTEYEAELRREEVRNERMAAGYAGTLIKRGNGTITLTGDNAFSGGLTIYEGSVAGLTNAFGSGKVTVEDGGNLSVLKTVKWEELTEQGFQAREKTSNSGTVVSATVKDGGTITLENGVRLGQVAFEGNGYVVATLSEQERGALRNAQPLEWNFTVKGEWNPDTFIDSGLAFYEVTDVNAVAAAGTGTDSQINLTFALADTTQFSTVAAMAQAGNTWMDNWSRQTALRTQETLQDDFYAASQNTSVMHANRLMNAAFVSCADCQTAALDESTQFWIQTWGVKGHADTNVGKADTQFKAALFGIENQWGSNFKSGAYLALGDDEITIGDSKIKGDVYHVGLYLDRTWEKFDWRTALGYSLVDRQSSRFAGLVDEVGHVAAQSDLSIWHGATQVRFRLIEGERFGLTPKLMAGFMRVNDDGMTEKIGAHSLSRKPQERNIGYAKIGLDMTERLSEHLQVGLGVNYNTYFGDKSVDLSQSIDHGAAVTTSMRKLDNAAEVLLDAHWQPSKATQLGVSYEGLFSGQSKEHGVRASLTYRF